MIDMSWTQNTTGVSGDIIAYRITNTASGAGTKLFNLYAGASGTTSEFSVDIVGTAVANGFNAGITGFTAGSALNRTEARGFQVMPFRLARCGELRFGAADSATPTAQSSVSKVRRQLIPMV